MSRELAVLVLAAGNLLATTYTTSQAGNWSSAATWGGAGVPGISDSVTITRPVTVDVNTTVGTSGAAGTIDVIVDALSTNTGSLTIGSGVTFVVRGDIQLRKSALTIRDSVLEFDSSGAALNTTIYKLRMGSTYGQSASEIEAPLETAVASAEASFQQGNGGYTAGQSVSITTTNAGAWNGYNGTAFRTIYEYASATSAPLIRFSQISIPAGKRVVSATLTVTVSSWGGANSLIAAYLKGRWDASSTVLGWLNSSSSSKWDAPGATGVGYDILAGDVSVPLKGAGEQIVTIPLDPTVVSDWLAKPATNQGVRLSVARGTARVNSNRYPTAASRPVLKIVVQ